MTTKMQTFALSVEPDYFNEVLEKVDVLALEQKSNRSAIIRQVLYDHFGVKAKSINYNYSKLIKQRTEQ